MQQDLSIIKSLCQEIVDHPSANTYAKSYANAVCDGSVENQASAMNIPLRDAITHQIAYILSNLRSRDPRLKEIKVALNQYK